MALLVQKYGGTSVGSIDRIKHVAEKIRAAKRAGNDLVVVVSAMAGETNRLVGLALQIAEIPDEREKDVLLASGEQVSVALLSLALKELGQPARSYLGHQVRIGTDKAYGRARIKTIDSTKIHAALKAGEVVVVAGFQGVDEDDNITTLGRGGSDTSAVALAAFLNAAGMRDLHRRGGRLYHRSRYLPRCKKTPAHFLRRNDRAGQRRGEGIGNPVR